MPKGGKAKDDKNAPVFTFVNCGVEQRGFNILGFVPRARALEKTRRHYQREMELIHQALEALDANQVRVVYRRKGLEIAADMAQRLHKKWRESVYPPPYDGRQAASPRA
jgi:hypothetical protein